MPILRLLLVAPLALSIACGGGYKGPDRNKKPSTTISKKKKKSTAPKTVAEPDETSDDASDATDEATDGATKKKAAPPKKKTSGDLLATAIPYPADKKAELEQLEQALKGLADGGREEQRKLTGTIESMGKAAAPALLNAFRTLDMTDQDQLGVGNFINDMLNRLYEPDEMFQFDPITEGEAGASSRKRTVRRWIKHVTENE